MIGNRFKLEEREGVDFPFYKDNPKLNVLDWVLLFMICFFSGLLPIIDPSTLMSLITSFLSLVVTLIITKLDISLFLKKLVPKDIPIIIVAPILSLLLVITLSFTLGKVGIKPNIRFYSQGVVTDIIYLVIILFGEELLKFCIFIFGLSLVYKLTNNRKVSVVFAAFLTMVLFGALHYRGVGTIYFNVFIQGFGASIFSILSYIKTKNVLVSYLIHLLYDIFGFIPLWIV